MTRLPPLISPHARLLTYQGTRPVLGSRCFLATGATLIGDVILGEESSIWFNAVLRADVHTIRVGRRTNIQDLAAIHVTPDRHPVRIGDRVTVGHSAVIHGCTLEDGCLIGMNATLLDGARVGEGALIGAGSVVTPRTVIPPGVLALGNPARVQRDLTDEEIRQVAAASELYLSYAENHARDLGLLGELFPES